LAKFELLRRPSLWCSDDPNLQQWRGELQTQRDTLAVLEAGRGQPLEKAWDNLKKWKQRLEVPRRLNPDELRACAGADLSPFITYYREKRLRGQRAYFGDAIRKRIKAGRLSKPWPFWLFIASVMAAIVHLLVHLLPDLAERLRAAGYNWALLDNLTWTENAALLFLLLAACLPVIAAGVRTYRGAFEFVRNIERFEAKLVALDSYDKELSKEKKPEEALEFIGYSEQILESEHREWLRLMTEAEWVG
jgi:hypothetical protein